VLNDGGRYQVAMLTYTVAELRALADVDRCSPPRAVHKRLFTFGLWRPAQRRRTAAHRSVAALGQKGRDQGDTAAHRSADRSTDSCSMAIGWLNARSVRNKVDAVSDIITDRRLDALAIQETWHTTNNDTCLRLVTPAGYAIVDAARTTGPLRWSCSRVPTASEVYADVNAGLQDVRVDMRAPEDGDRTSHRHERVSTGVGERQHAVLFKNW